MMTDDFIFHNYSNYDWKVTSAGDRCGMNGYIFKSFATVIMLGKEVLQNNTLNHKLQ